MLERQKMTKNNEKMTKEGEGCIFILLPLSWTLITFIVMNISIYYVNIPYSIGSWYWGCEPLNGWI